MNYEVQRAIEGKADQWKVDGLSHELQQAKRDIQELNHKLSHAEGRISNQYQAIQDLLNILLESGKFEEHENQIHQIKGYY